MAWLDYVRFWGLARSQIQLRVSMALSIHTHGTTLTLGTTWVPSFLLVPYHFFVGWHFETKLYHWFSHVKICPCGAIFLIEKLSLQNCHGFLRVSTSFPGNTILRSCCPCTIVLEEAGHLEHVSGAGDELISEAPTFVFQDAHSPLLQLTGLPPSTMAPQHKIHRGHNLPWFSHVKQCPCGTVFLVETLPSQNFHTFL